MATGLCDAAKPQRYDLTMSRRTRRPAAAAANVVTDCSQDQSMEAESQKMTMIQQQRQDQVTQLKDLFQCPCATQPEYTVEHKVLQQSEDAEEQTPRQKSQEEEAQHDQQQQWLQCDDNSRRLSLQELIDDEPINGAKDAATGSQEASSATAAAVQGAAEAEAAAKQPEHVAGKKKKMIGMVRRYVRVRSIKPKPAPERNVEQWRQ